MERKAYPSDIGDEEWDFVAPYLRPKKAPQRDCSLCEMFNELRWLVRDPASFATVLGRMGPAV